LSASCSPAGGHCHRQFIAARSEESSRYRVLFRVKKQWICAVLSPRVAPLVRGLPVSAPEPPESAPVSIAPFDLAVLLPNACQDVLCLRPGVEVKKIGPGGTASMATARAGAFALIACSPQCFLLCVFSKRKRGLAGRSIGHCVLTARRAEDLSIAKASFTACCQMMQFEVPSVCASRHIIPSFLTECSRSSPCPVFIAVATVKTLTQGRLMHKAENQKTIPRSTIALDT
jgi:hypothetical protein